MPYRLNLGNVILLVLLVFLLVHNNLLFDLSEGLIKIGRTCELLGKQRYMGFRPVLFIVHKTSIVDFFVFNFLDNVFVQPHDPLSFFPHSFFLSPCLCLLYRGLNNEDYCQGKFGCPNHATFRLPTILHIFFHLPKCRYRIRTSYHPSTGQGSSCHLASYSSQCQKVPSQTIALNIIFHRPNDKCPIRVKLHNLHNSQSYCCSKILLT